MGALFVWGCMIWFFLMLVATPLPFQLLGGLVSLEFLFTRAVDRGLWLRTERAAVMIIVLGPLILNLLLSPLSPKLAFDRARFRFTGGVGLAGALPEHIPAARSSLPTPPGKPGNWSSGTARKCLPPGWFGREWSSCF